MKPTVRFTFIVTALFGLLAASIALADDPFSATQPSQKQQTIMTYDISDLLRNTADYPLIADNSGNGPGPGSVPQPPQLFAGNTMPGAAQPVPSTTALTPESLLAIIKQMVLDQNSNIALLGNTVILQASPEVHQKIRSMLDSMHQQQVASSAMVCTRVFWLSLSPTEVASIFEKVKAANGKTVAPMPEIPDSLTDASHLYCQAQTICFSGQTVHVVSGRAQSYVSNVTPVVGSNTVGYSPTVSEALSGVTVQIKPQLLSDGAAVVDVASMVNESGSDMRKIDVASGLTEATTQPGASSSIIESPNVVQQEFHTTVRLPVGKKILIGGMTLEPAAKDQAGRQLFLAIEVDAVQ